MRLLILSLGLLAALGSASCVTESAFQCEDSAQCGDGHCEANGFCSFQDPSCASGYRYDERAGLADSCVGDTIVVARAVTAAMGEVSPNNIYVGTGSHEFFYDLALEIGDTDTGVDAVWVSLPGFLSGARLTSVSVDGEAIDYVDAGQGSAFELQLAERIEQTSHLQLHFQQEAPSVADIIGLTIPSRVDDTTTTEAAQDVVEGNGDGDDGDANRWSVTVSDGLPAATAALVTISPSDVGVDSTANLFVYECELTIEAGDSGIDELSITVPDGYGNPQLVDLEVAGTTTAFTDSSDGNGLVAGLSAKIEASTTVTIRFTADGMQSEDNAGTAFRSSVRDTAMPLVAPMPTTPKDPDSWTVTTTSWAASSSVLAEVSPNSVTPGSSNISFAYDLQVEVGPKDTGFDLIELSLPGHLENASVSSVGVNGGNVGFSSDVLPDSLAIYLDTKVTSSSSLRLSLVADVVSCSNDAQGDLVVHLDDLDSGFSSQEGMQGDANGSDEDDDSWTVTSVGTPRLFWADRATAKIQSGINQGCGVDELVSGLTDPRLMAADNLRDKLYWADVDVGQIWRANQDGTGLEVIITGLTSPSGLALDEGAGKLYWTDYGTDKIQRADLDGGNKEDLITRGPLPYGIELDLDNGKLYWADTTDNMVLRADLDGSDVEVILTGVSQAADIALDPSKNRLYVSSHGADKIIRSTLGGNGRQDIVTNLDQPVGLAYDAQTDRLYWADSGSGRIQSAGTDGNDIISLITGLSDPQGLVLGR